MKILYDGQIYTLQPTGGITRYFSNIISRLPNIFSPTLTSIYSAKKIHYPIHPNLELYEVPGFRPYQLSSKIYSYYFRWLNNQQSFNIFHPTYYFQLAQQPFHLTRYPLVITVHDMIHEIFAEAVEPDGRTIQAKKDAIQAADKLICVSENTKRDLLKFYPTVEEKTVVIYEASELAKANSYGSEEIPDQPYFLYVGSRDRTYKNFDTLLIAFSKVISINSDIILCVVGSPFNKKERQQIAELNLVERIRHYHYASDAHLAKLYRCSVAFIYPSLYEGFGIPPLEAMACGTPVIASDSSSIPEVIGDAGILFPPKAISDLADIMLHLLESPSQRDYLIAKGYERYQLFSWDKTVKQTLKVYQSLL